MRHSCLYRIRPSQLLQLASQCHYTMLREKRDFSILVERDMRHLAEYMSTDLAERQHVFSQIMNFEEAKPIKSESLSDAWRKKAREIFTKSEKHNAEVDKQSWECLTVALATAPLNSLQYILALDARSKLLLHMRLEKAAEMDIDRVLEEINGRSEFRVLQCNLLLRKVKCWLIVKGFFPGILTVRILTAILELPESQLRKRMSEKLLKLSRAAMVHADINGIVDYGQRIRIKEARYHYKYKSDFNSDAIGIHYTDDIKYGFSAMAMRKLNPGDIISAERQFATLANRANFLVCNHCMALSWAPVPCYECNMIFCGEKCRVKAMREYHYLECVLLRNELSIKNGNDEWFPSSAKLGLRMLIKARIKSKSNKELFKRIREYEGGDAPLTSASRCTQFETLYMFGMNYRANQRMLLHAFVALILVAKRCALFKESFYEFDSIDDLLNDVEALELGALILRFILISERYSRMIFEPYTDLYKDEKNQLNSINRAQSPRGLSMSYIAGYFNHSCYPNVATIINDDGQIILYVLRPIEKYEEMVICYTAPFYSAYPRDVRRNMLYSKYEFVCDCEACHFNWPATPYYGYSYLEHIILCESSTETILSLFGEYDDPFNANNNTMKNMIPILCRAIRDMAKIPQYGLYYQSIALFCMLHKMMQYVLCPPQPIAKCYTIESGETEDGHGFQNDEPMNESERLGLDWINEPMSSNERLSIDEPMNDDQGNDGEGNYDQESYDQENYEQNSHEQESDDEENYEQKNYDQESDDQENYEQNSYDQESDDQENYEQNSYDQESDDQENYEQKNYDQESDDQENYDQESDDQENYEQKNSDQESDDQENYEQKNYDQENCNKWNDEEMSDEVRNNEQMSDDE